MFPAAYDLIASVRCPSLLTIFNTILALCGYYVLNGLWKFYFPRPGTFPEDYPFQSTFILIMENHRILDLCLEYFKRTYDATGKKSFVLNVLGLPPFVMSNDVRNVTHILKTNFENYGKSGDVFKNKFQGLLGDGIFNADGAMWFAHRKTSAHLFKFNKFKTTVLEVFNSDLDILLQVIEGKINTAFDMQDLLHRFTLESISRIAFGVELGCLTNDNVSFAADFDYCTACINSSMINPLWRLERYFTPAGWKYYLCLFRLNRYAYRMISERRQQFAADSSARFDRNDLLSLYLDRDNFTAGSENNNSSNISSNSGKSIASDTSQKSIDSNNSSGGSSGKYSSYMEPTDSNLRDVILNMIIAGRDTTAQALSWTFYRLCIHPEVQEKVREEVRKVLQRPISTAAGGSGNGSSSSNNSGSESGAATTAATTSAAATSTATPDTTTTATSDTTTTTAAESELELLESSKGIGSISMQSLQELRYTEAVCHEVLRLHPSVPKEAKSVQKDDVLPDGTIVKRGDIFSFQAYSMGRDEQLWGKDALEFVPQRFIDNPKPSPFVFTAFQAGPRTCLGQNFAIMEMKCVLARLLLAFEFKLEQDPASVTYANSLTLPVKGGLRMSAKSLLSK